MPVLVELSFRLKEVPEVLYPADVHGLFFNLFEESIAERLHREPKKPFSIKGFSLEGSTLRLELALLEDKLYPALIHGYYFPKRDLHLRGIPLSPIKGKGLKEKKALSYQELLETEPHRKLQMEFFSPTAFNRFKFDYPLPEPHLVFYNLASRWNIFSEIPVEISETEVLKNTMVYEFEGATQEFIIDQKLKRVGFVGRVVFFVKDPEVAKKLSVLALFSNFAGVGIKTTMGMGAVKASLKGAIQRSSPEN
jgi:CRISPR-associated endoribonuclease Cas6